MSDTPRLRCARFELNISASDFLAYYQGRARAVVVRGYDGRRLQIPAAALKGFVSRVGVYGVFEIDFDDNNKLQAIRRIENGDEGL